MSNKMKQRTGTARVAEQKPAWTWWTGKKKACDRLIISTTINAYVCIASAQYDILMTTVRPGDSQSQSVLQYGRKRSNTAQSLARMPPGTAGAPLRLGDSKVLNTWVHDPKESPKVILNRSWWPGVAEGDLLRVTQSEDTSGYLFTVPKDEGCPKPTLQANPSPSTVSVPPHLASDIFTQKCCRCIFHEKQHGSNGDQGTQDRTTFTTLAHMGVQVDKDTHSADYVEFSFADQYLGRNEMWRLGKHLVGQCVFVDQDISFIGVIAAKVQNIYVKGQQVGSALS